MTKPAKTARRRAPAAPMYEVLKRDIETMIRTGRIKPGERVPSESELIARYRVSNTTARRSLDELEAAGWLERKRGKGTFVSRLADVLHRDRVALVVRDFYSLAHPFLATVAGTLERALERAGVHVFIARAKPSDRLSQDGQHLADQLEHEDCRHALILSNLPLPMIEPLVERGVHCLGVNTCYLDDRIPHIATDYLASQLLGLEELAARGHRRIAVLVAEPVMAGMGVMNSSSLVAKAYATARERYPELAASPLIREVGPQASLAAVVRGLIDDEDPPTALVCWDELAALDVIGCLSDLSIGVPDEISVVGAKLLPCSPVACVEQPLEEMALRAADAMLEWMKGRRPASQKLGPKGFLPRETIAEASAKVFTS